MQIKIFSIPIIGGREFEEEMNRFMRGNKILSIREELVSDSMGSYWTFYVRYLERSEREKPTSSSDNTKKDYKLLLDEATFRKFSMYREIRKTIANEDAIPAFAVFSDEELSKIASFEGIPTLSLLADIKGIGQKRLDKYGEKFLNFIEKQKIENETNRKPD